jgi:hypothetical protein
MRVILKPGGVFAVLLAMGVLALMAVRPWEKREGAAGVAGAVPSPASPPTNPANPAVTPAASPTPVADLIQNGDFRRSDADGSGAPFWDHVGMKRRGAETSIRDEAGRGRFAEIRKEKGAGDEWCGVSQDLPLDPAWKRLGLSARLRTRGVTKGKEHWQRAAVLTPFLDANGKIFDYRESLELDGDNEWAELKAVVNVPEGAKVLRLQVGVYGPEGTLSVDDVRLSVIE